MPTMPPARFAESLTDCAFSLCELAALTSSGVLTLSDEEQQTVSFLAELLARIAKGEPAAPWWPLLRQLAAADAPESPDYGEARARLRATLSG